MSLLIECRKQWQVPNKRSPIPVVNVWMSISVIYHEHKLQKRHNTISFNLTTSADQCDLFKNFLKYHIWGGFYILLLKSAFFFQGDCRRWEEEVNYNMDWSCFPRHTAQVTLLICITLPSFSIVKYIFINLQYNWFFKIVWFSEGCVLQWQEFQCGLNLFRMSKYTVWILKQQQLAPGTEITIDYSVDTQVVSFIWMTHWRQIPPKGHYDNSN